MSIRVPLAVATAVMLPWWLVNSWRRSVKYEEIYLNAYASVPEARAGIGRYFDFYNSGRPHSSLGGLTPDEIYCTQPLLAAA